MSDVKKTAIVIDDNEYIFEEMMPEQQLLINHIADLDHKINSAQFKLQQLNVGKDAFVQMLKESLKSKTE